MSEITWRGNPVRTVYVSVRCLLHRVWINKYISRRMLHIIAVAILYLRSQILILDAMSCVYLVVPSDCSPVGDLDPAGLYTPSQTHAVIICFYSLLL